MAKSRRATNAELAKAEARVEGFMLLARSLPTRDQRATENARTYLEGHQDGQLTLLKFLSDQGLLKSKRIGRPPSKANRDALIVRTIRNAVQGGLQLKAAKLVARTEHGASESQVQHAWRDALKVQGQ